MDSYDMTGRQQLEFRINVSNKNPSLRIQHDRYQCITFVWLGLLYFSNKTFILLQSYLVGLCDNGKTYVLIMPIMHYKIISRIIVIAIKL